MQPALDVIVINWNSGGMLERCIQSIREGTPAYAGLVRLIVIDNASIDHSAEFLSGSHDCTFIRNDGNRGFAAACNQGAAAGSAAFVLFLNPDTCLHTNALTRPVEFLSQPENASVGIVGIRLLDQRGQVQRTCARFPSALTMASGIVGLDRLAPGVFPSHFLSEWDHSGTRVVDQVPGAFFLVRRALFEALQGFDERFFMYYEDLDFSLRALEQGWKSMYFSGAQALHVGGASSQQVPGLRLYYVLRSRTLYCLKHFGMMKTLGLLTLTLGVEPVARFVHACMRGEARNAGFITLAYVRLIASLPALFLSGSRAA